MAEDREDRYKEGRDFEWVTAPGGHKTRRFFSKKDKSAGDKPAEKPKKKGPTSSAPTRSPRPRPNPAVDARSAGGPGERRSAEASSERKKRDVSRIRDMAEKAIDRGEAVAGRKPRRKPSRVMQTSFSPSAEAGAARTAKDQAAREEARAEGGRESPLGRMIDDIFGGRTRNANPKRRTGMAKGGLVKANCGASMKPTQRKKYK